MRRSRFKGNSGIDGERCGARSISRLPGRKGRGAWLERGDFTAVRLYRRAHASLDAEDCTARSIPVCNTAGGAGTEAAPAELALGLLLAAARAIPAADANMRAGRFQESVPVGISLAGKTIGIIGLGRLGSFMAGYCRALNMTVLAWSENLTAEKALAAGATLASKDELLSRSDAISIHMSSRSRGLIGASDIARMKPGALLINTSRGPIVEEAALIEAVESRRIVAALDVYYREPLPADHPLRHSPNTADAASRLWRSGDMGRVLRAKHRKCARLHRR